MSLRAAETPGVARPVEQWVALPDAPSATGLARRFLLDALPEDRPEVLDVVVLLATELVSNAVLHGSGPIRVQVDRHQDTVRVEVHDDGFPFDAPHVAPSDPRDETHGLGLVAACASSWGSYSNGPSVAGKTVWFELSGDGLVAASPSEQPRPDIDLTAQDPRREST